MIKKEIRKQEKEGKDGKKINWRELIYAYALENALQHEKAIESAVLQKLFQHGLEKEKIKEVFPLIREVVLEVNKLAKKEKERNFQQYSDLVVKHEHKEKGLKELPNIKDKMVFRLAPYPSGALHIGNAKTYILNALYAEKYQGKLIFMMDDTIGSEEKQIIKEAYRLIPNAFDWLKIKYEEPILFKSDRLDIYYKYAEELIKKGKAYVCSCNQEKLKENRVNQIECSCRQYPSEFELKKWKKMFSAKPGEFTLRIKTSMQHPNPAFRDRVLFRISDREHPKVGKKYNVWPLLEFSWAIDDHLLGITHIIRGKDLMMESEMERFIWDIFGWEHPELMHGGLVRIEGAGAKISKSKAQQEVKSGQFSGWDDPRTWSIQSLKRRGIKAESIREFIKEIGLNENDIVVPIENLYSINRKSLDPVANRYYFVELPVKLSLKNLLVQEAEVKTHPDKKETRKIILGKEIFISERDFDNFKGKEIRLLHLFNLKLPLNKDEETKITGIGNKDIQKIQWVSKYTKATILMPEGYKINGLAEEAIEKLKKNDVVQFERVGFCRFDGLNKKTKEYEFWFAHR